MTFKRAMRIIVLLVSIPLLGFSQPDSTLVTKNFKFTDGLYTSFEEFQQNKPKYLWEDIRISLASNPQTFLIQVERVISRNGEPIPVESLWGLTLQGIPYIQVDSSLSRKPLPSFTALRLRGKLCFFEVAVDTVEEVKMAAYNPLTGLPFREGSVEKPLTLWFKYLIPFATGEIIPFTLKNFLELIQDDPVLHRTYRNLSPEEAEERLFKGVLIYDDRNPVYIMNEEE